MITRVSKFGFCLVAVTAVAACAGLPAANELRIDNDGKGRLSGTAGADFTPQEILKHVSQSVCGGGPVNNFRTSYVPSTPDITIFSGVCASGRSHDLIIPAGGTIGVAPQVAEPAPVEYSTPGNRAGWDGSTPFVD